MDSIELWASFSNSVMVGKVSRYMCCTLPPPFYAPLKIDTKSNYTLQRLEYDASNLMFTIFGCHCQKECGFYPVIFHINENYLNLSFIGTNTCTSILCMCHLIKFRRHYIPVNFTSPFETAVEKIWSKTISVIKGFIKKTVKAKLHQLFILARSMDMA